MVAEDRSFRKGVATRKVKGEGDRKIAGLGNVMREIAKGGKAGQWRRR
jgi:hypothetical protein